MYRFGLMLLAASLFIGCNSATEPATKPSESESAKKVLTESDLAAAQTAFETLKSDSKEAEAAFMQKVRSAPREEQMELFQSGGEKKAFAEKFLNHAKEYCDHSGVESVFEAASLAATNGDDTVSSAALGLIADKFSDDEKLVDMLQGFGARFPAQKHEDFLTDLVEKSTNNNVKGAASYAKIKLLQGIGDLKEMASDENFRKMIPETSLSYLEKNAGDGLNDKIESMLGTVSEKYSDVSFGPKSIGELAEEELFVFKHLTVGKIAPDIEGKDLDDEAFKLSDYRGKVVLLDFWGDW